MHHLNERWLGCDPIPTGTEPTKSRRSWIESLQRGRPYRPLQLSQETATWIAIPPNSVQPEPSKPWRSVTPEAPPCNDHGCDLPHQNNRGRRPRFSPERNWAITRIRVIAPVLFRHQINISLSSQRYVAVYRNDMPRIYNAGKFPSTRRNSDSGSRSIQRGNVLVLRSIYQYNPRYPPPPRPPGYVGVWVVLKELTLVVLHCTKPHTSV